MQYSTSCTARYRSATTPNQGRKLKLARRRSAQQHTATPTATPTASTTQHSTQYAPRRARYRERKESFPLTRRLWIVGSKLGIRAACFLFLFPLLSSCPGRAKITASLKLPSTTAHYSQRPFRPSRPDRPGGQAGERAGQGRTSIFQHSGTLNNATVLRPMYHADTVFGRQSRPLPIGSLTETPAYF